MDTRDVFSRSIGWAGTLCVVVAALPFLAVAAFVLRAVFLVTAIVGLVGLALLCCVSPGFRRWIDVATRPPGPSSSM